MGTFPSIRTRITAEYGLDLPIISAGLTFVATAPLVAAVSNAGAMGTLGALMVSPADLRKLIQTVRALTRRPFAVDFVTEFMEDAHVEVCLEQKVPVAVFFWSLPCPTHVERLRQGGTRVWAEVGSVTEARAAVDRGADAVVVRGSEAGDHGQGAVPALSLTPAVVDAVSPVPVIASGGIVDGRGVVAALALGAEAAWCGTRFRASTEALAHEACRARVRGASAEETVRMALFGPEWPDWPLRVTPSRRTAATAARASRATSESSYPGSIGDAAVAGHGRPRPASRVSMTTRGSGDAVGDGPPPNQATAATVDPGPAREIVARIGMDAVSTVRHRLDTIFSGIAPAR